MTEKEVLEKIEEAARDGRTVLALSHRRVESVPREIGRLCSLRVLYLHSNQLASLPEEIGKLTKLTKLYLYENQLTVVPRELGKLTNLCELYLQDNRLTSVPPELGELTGLTELDLSRNRLTRVPAELGKLMKLPLLDLRSNQLTSVPAELGKLTNLTKLDLRSNKLTSVPGELGMLTKLSTLYLDGNQLRSLPRELGELANLKALWLEGNGVSDISCLMGLGKVKSLDLSTNQISELPRGIVDLGIEIRWEWEIDGEGVTLEGNPLESPPVEVVKRGTKAVRDYFRQLDEKGKDYLYEAKLLIVGEAGAGKTTLAKKIEDEDYVLREDEDSTKGIDVIEWHFPMEGGQDFRVNIWDFGGQEIYHATHQFFLTKRSLYALVADDRKEDTDFNYWLNVVELLSDRSPVLIVKNEKQDRHREINESALRGQFANIKEIVATNLATNRGLDEVKEEIRHHIGKLPHVGSELPKTWVKVREALEKDDRNYIGLDEYFDICEQNGFTLEKDKLQLSGYLHDLGVCLHFQGDVLLKETVILRPEWGTDAVYKVLDDEGVIKNKGRLTQADAERIWDEERYAGMHAELLQLMINFKLCCEIRGTGEYIVPELLTKNQPKYKWDEGENLIMRYTYEFMPKGIVTQLIVAMHPLIAGQDLVWRDGVVLERDGTKAEVVETYGKREIKIRVVGKDRRRLMTIVTYELDRIHDTYKRLKYSKWIPCNCDGCRGEQEPYFYRHDILKKFLADSEREIQCQKCYKMVNVMGLIDGVMVRKERVAEERRFRVALSFPGERRGFLGKVAGGLVEEFGKDEVFYDKNFEAELARPDFDTYLQRIYHDDSELIVVFLCAEYENKEWCGLEWRAIRDLIKKKKTSEIMLVRFDETEIAGVLSIDGYVSAEGREPEEIAKQIIERYRINEEGQMDEKQRRRKR